LLRKIRSRDSHNKDNIPFFRGTQVIRWVLYTDICHILICRKNYYFILYYISKVHMQRTQKEEKNVKLTNLFFRITLAVKLRSVNNCVWVRVTLIVKKSFLETSKIFNRMFVIFPGKYNNSLLDDIKTSKFRRFTILCGKRISELWQTINSVKAISFPIKIGSSVNCKQWQIIIKKKDFIEVFKKFS